MQKHVRNDTDAKRLKYFSSSRCLVLGSLLFNKFCDRLLGPPLQRAQSTLHMRLVKAVLSDKISISSLSECNEGLLGFETVNRALLLFCLKIGVSSNKLHPIKKLKGHIYNAFIDLRQILRPSHSALRRTAVLAGTKRSSPGLQYRIPCVDKFSKKNYAN